MEAHEGFSIREYVSRMRTVNVVKCWPFDETTSEESVKSLLPPITVRKFIWWFDGLDYLHSENFDSSKKNNKKKKKKVAVQEKGESSFRHEDDDNEEAIEERKAKSSRAKAKAPKKRSILEIFAVAPPVERVLSSEEENSAEEEDGFCADSKFSCHEEINWGLKGKRNEKNNKKKKLKKSKDVILNKAKKVIKKIRKKKQKKADAKIDQSVSNKENCFMFKQQDQDKDNGIPDSSNEMDKGNDNITSDPVSLPKKQPRVLQHLDGDKKISMAAACKAFKLIAKNQHPKRGILKNHAKEIFPQQPTKCVLLQESTQKSDKHVTFSQKDNILRRKPDTHNEKDSIIVETNGTIEDVSNRINENEVEIRSAISSNTTLDYEMNDLGTSGPRFPPMWFKDYFETYNEPSNKRPQAFPQTNAFNVPYETLPYFSPKELLQTVYSPLEGKRSMHGMNDDFVGLPLNSQGELIRLSSSDKREFNQLNLFPVKGHSKENPVVFVPSRKINDHSFHSETSLFKEDYRFNHENEKIIPTMRLMGKEFTIGGRASQGFEDGSIWKDKQIINEQHFNTSISMHDRSEGSLGKLREFYPSEVKIQHSYSFPHFDCQISSMQRSNGFTARKINPGLSPVAFPAVYNSESLFPNPSSDIQLRNKQNLSHAPRSAIRFPFVHPDLEGHANRAPLFFDAPENGTLMSNFQTHHNSGGPNHWSESSVPHKPEAAFCLYNPFPSMGPVSSPPTTLLTQQEPMLCYPISSVQKRNINQKKINSRIGINRGLGYGKRAKSQLSGVPNLSQCAFTKSTTSVDFEDVQDVETAFESCSATNNLIYDEYGDDQNATRISPWCVGPIKLAAGAKHILKACQQIDHQYNSRSINTNSIPLNATNAGFRFSESEINSAKIYKF